MKNNHFFLLSLTICCTISSLSSCVQDEMYDDFYDDDLCYSSPRQKRAKDNNEFQVYDWGEIVSDCRAIEQSDCVRACLLNIFGYRLSSSEIDSILQGHCDSQGVYETDFLTVLDACITAFNNEEAAREIKWYQVLSPRQKAERHKLSNASSGNVIGLVIAGQTFRRKSGDTGTLKTGHAFIVDSSDSNFVTSIVDDSNRNFYFKCKKSLVSCYYQVNISNM